MRPSKVALSAAIAVAALIFAPSAQALDCDSVAADDSKKISTAGLDGINRAADKVVGFGATVRVRLIGDYGTFTDLKPYFESVRKSCPSWRALDGGTRNNIVVFMVELKHRKIGLFYGSQWIPAFRGNHDARIRDDLMAPRLRDGDFAGAFVVGLAEAGKLLDAFLHPKPTGPTTIINNPPSDNSGFVKLLAWIFGIGVVFVLGYFGLQLLTSRRGEGEQRNVAQREARTRRQAAADAVNNFKPTVLKAKVNSLAATLSEEDVKVLRTQLEDLEKTHAKAAAKYARASGISENNPDMEGLGVKEYEQIASTFGAILGELETIDGARIAVEQAVEKALRDAGKAPEIIAAAETALNNARSAIAAAQKEFKTSAAEAIFKEAADLHVSAKAALEGKKAGTAAKLAEQSARKAAEALEDVQALAKRRTATEQGISTLGQRIKATESLVAEAKIAFSEISTDFAERSGRAVKGNGTEAEKRIGRAKKALDAATAASGMSEQDWPEAEKRMAAANVQLDEADQLLRAITDLRADLISAKQKAPSEIEAARADIEKAADYVQSHDEDIGDNVEAELGQAQNLLAKAEEELAKAKPDYIYVVKTAIDANTAADGILERAQAEHVSTERLRQRSSSLMEEAQRSIKATKRYLDTHDDDVEDRTWSKLQRAEEALKQAKRAAKIDARIKLATKADELADEALEDARKSVADEDETIRTSSTRRAGGSDRRTSEWGSHVVIVNTGNAHSSDYSHGATRGAVTDDDPPSSTHGGSSDFGTSSNDSPGSSSDFGDSSPTGGESSNW